MAHLQASLRVLQETMQTILHVHESNVHGRGLFAARCFSRGEPIYIVSGRRVRDHYDRYYSKGPNWIALGYRTWLIPNQSNPIMFTNHACQPNSIISDRLRVVALTAVAPGDEILMDYSTTEIDPFWRMYCCCRSASCRKRIRAFQHLPESLQEYYGQFMRRAFLDAARRIDVSSRPAVR